MALKVFLIALWGVFFLVLNVAAKKVAASMALDRGAIGLVWSVFENPWAYIMVALYGVCGVLYMGLLRIMPVSVAGPTILSLGIVLLTATGALVFNEDVFKTTHILGVILCLAGIVLLQVGTR